MRQVRNFLLSPITITLLMKGSSFLMAFSMSTGGMFSPPDVMISSGRGKRKGERVRERTERGRQREGRREGRGKGEGKAKEGEEGRKQGGRGETGKERKREEEG